MPPYEEELPEGLAKGLAFVRSSVETTADSGKPPPMPLPQVITSGTTPSWSTPQNFPVRPKPVIISSAMKRAPWSFAIARTAGRKPGGGMTLPAVPCIGSTMTAATSPADWFRMTLRVSSAQAMPQSGYSRFSGQR